MAKHKQQATEFTQGVKSVLNYYTEGKNEPLTSIELDALLLCIKDEIKLIENNKIIW